MRATVSVMLFLLCSNAHGQRNEARLTIEPKFQAPATLVVTGETNVPRGHEVKVTIFDRFYGTQIDQVTTKVLRGGKFKATKFTGIGKKNKRLKPGKYLVVISIELGRPSFFGDLDKNLADKPVDQLVGPLVYKFFGRSVFHSEDTGMLQGMKSRQQVLNKFDPGIYYVVNMVPLNVGGLNDAADQANTAQELLIELKAISEKLGPLIERGNRARAAAKSSRVTWHELRPFNEKTQDLYDQLEKRVAKIEPQWIREDVAISLESYRARSFNYDFPDVRDKEAKKRLKVADTWKSDRGTHDHVKTLELLLFLVDETLESDGLLDLTDSTGKKKVRARFFNHYNNKWAIQDASGAVKAYERTKFDRASLNKLARYTFRDRESLPVWCLLRIGKINK